MTTTAKERPILFSGPMVRAILDGKKTQTRRIVKTPANDWPESYALGVHQGVWGIHEDVDDAEARVWRGRCPYGLVGDRLWVREAHYVERAGYEDGSGRFILFRASEPEAPVGKWTPSIRMPRWASRITLAITDIRLQRLQEITEEDAIAEGAAVQLNPDYDDDDPMDDEQYSHVAGYQQIWNEINGPDSWEANPWVWAIGFDRSNPRSD